jgi:hypothetical protein
MKLTLRVALIFISPVLAYLSAIWAARFTGVPMPDGSYEGTPVTIVVGYGVFAFVLITLLLAGNLSINRWIRSKNSK